MANRWVKLFEKITEWEWYKDSNTARVFFHLLVKANYKAVNWKGVALSRGELITSLPQLASELGLTVKQVRRALDNLKQSGEISEKATNHYRVTAVKNYALYQGEEGENEDVRADRGQAKGQAKGRQTGRREALHNEPNTENGGRQEHEKRADKRAADIEGIKNIESLSLIADEAFAFLGAPMPPMMQSDITDLLTEGRADEELILEAIKIAKSKGKRSWPYAYGIVKSMIADGFTTGAAYRESKMPKPGSGTEGKSSERGVNAGGRYREQVDWEKQFRTVEDMEG